MIFNNIRNQLLKEYNDRIARELNKVSLLNTEEEKEELDKKLKECNL